MSQPVTTPTYQLAEVKLGQKLDEFLVDRYDGRPHTHLPSQTVFSAGECEVKHPYLRIAYELTALTGVEVTHEAVRKWYAILTGKAGRTPADSLRARTAA
jgi:hypothetical protein